MVLGIMLIAVDFYEKKMNLDTENIIECGVCGIFVDKTRGSHTNILKCPRCDTKLNSYVNKNSDALFYAISALLLFILVNIYPLISLSFTGLTLHTTLIGTVVTLFTTNLFFVAVIVFFTIVLMPLLNSLIIIMSFIQIHTKFKIFTETLLHDGLKFTQAWTFVEVFILSIIVTYIKLTGMVSSTKFDWGFYVLLAYIGCFYLSNKKYQGERVFGE